MHSGTAQCIFDKVKDVLKERGIDTNFVIRLGSDGASVMMGTLWSRSTFKEGRTAYRCTTLLATLNQLHDRAGPEETALMVTLTTPKAILKE